jgi:galactose oxidase
MCSGMSFLPDGHLLATGGDPDDGMADSGVGNPYTTIFDPATNTWSSGDQMDFLRWYPSNVVLPDGRTLIIGGQAAPGGNSNINVMEVFDPNTLQVSRMPTGATKWMGLYPRTVLLENGQVLKAGKGVRTFRFDPAVPKWYFVDEMLGGGRKQGSVVLLPGNMKAMVCGGRALDGTITRSAEVIDMSAPNPQWRLVGSLNRARQNHSVVILPDGKVLIVGGGSTPQSWGSPVGLTEMFDPETEVFVPLASQTTNRTYHSTAVLLPDGRVISGGANSKLPEQTTVEIYSPPYLFRGTRPAITSVSSATLSWGASVEITTPDAASIDQVVLMKPGADTHQMNFDQRRIECPFTATPSSIIATLPSTAQANPPGYYMLFILNDKLVPSVATFVHVA